MWLKVAMKISNITELHEVKHENYKFFVEENNLRITNTKEKIEFNIEITEGKVLKTAKTVEKYTGLKLELDSLDEREVLSFIEDKGFNKVMWNPIGKAMHKYNMVEPGDRIAVGISGGKDSMTLLNALVRIKKIVNFEFEIIPIHIHPSVDSAKFDKVAKYCEKLGLELQVEKTDLMKFLFEEKKPKNPCFLCGRIRRGILYRMMKEQNINKLALGHHKDDIIETFLMNIFYQGNMLAMKPSYTSEEYGVQVIRPLAFVEEKDIIRYVKRVDMPILVSECPYETNDNSRRLKMKNLIKDLAEDNSEIRSVILNGIKDLLVD